jgi:type IX secretion system PorP/SprF family membrane protein
MQLYLPYFLYRWLIQPPFKKQIVFCCSFFLFTTTNSYGQDVHFSQFFVSPITLNPAYTGKFDGQLRLAGNYRSQWHAINKAFTTATFSVDGNMLKKNLPENDTWGIGAMALTDISGDGLFKKNSIALSTAYHKSLNEDAAQQISVGFQASITQHRFDLSKAIFADQLSGSGLIPSRDFTSGYDLNIGYVDVNAGVMYSTLLPNSSSNHIYGGIAVYHIVQPKESFQAGNFNLPRRFSLNVGGAFELGTNTTLYTNNIVQLQGRTNELVLGGAVAVNLNGDPVLQPTNIYFGAWGRFTNGERTFADAFFPYMGMEFNNMRIGASYDVNVSSLKAASRWRGGVEISMIYIYNNKSYQPKGKAYWCPKF